MLFFVIGICTAKAVPAAGGVFTGLSHWFAPASQKRKEKVCSILGRSAFLQCGIYRPGQEPKREKRQNMLIFQVFQMLARHLLYHWQIGTAQAVPSHISFYTDGKGAVPSTEI
ncbi:hypothetical protein [Marinobacterium stanieri]|uniref:hypothetical protein n=1 Tax=Marinobacterium stanieri TaxID=49186 RepID=UPI00111581A8|nr:hypothetical protein [Marinobacterium stanieri]